MTRGIRSGKGLSLLEVLVVLAALGAILLIAMPNFVRLLQEWRARTAAEQIVVNMRFARNAAVNQKVPYRATIQDEGAASNPNTYAILYDPQRSGSYQKVPTLDPYLPPGTKIKAGSIGSVDFDTTGRANPIGSVLVEGVDNSLYTITINLSGAVTLN